MNKRVKICFIATISKSLEWFVVDTAKYLFNHGYKDITFIANMDENFINSNSSYAHCINLCYKRGINPFNFLKSIKQTNEVFKKEHFDLIYYFTPNAAFYASLAGKKQKIANRIYAQCGIRYVSVRGLKRLIFKFIEKRTCKMSTEIRSQSPLNMQFAINEKLDISTKFKVLGIGGTTGVDLKYCDSFDHAKMRESLRLSYRISSDSFIFGYVGRLNSDKGCNELLEAFCELNKNNKDIYLLHIGMVDDSNMIKRKNFRFYLNNSNIIKTGNIPAKKVYEYMSMMDVLVHPTYREGFGKVLQEAMGMSLPILTTDVVGPKEVVENNVSGILVKAKDSTALKDGMLKLMNNKDLRDRLAKNGRKRAETYFERTKMLNNIYCDLNEILGFKND